MRVLAIVHQLPMYDRASGGLRFFEMLKILTARHEVSISCYECDLQTRRIGQAEMQRYVRDFEAIGVRVLDTDPRRVMREVQFDVVLFEFYFAASLYLTEARLLQPRAAKIIDSVDVNFNRLFAKARLTGARRDRREAERVKHSELKAYRAADYVIAVTDEDRRIILHEEPMLSVGVVPNIHAMQPLDDAKNRVPDSLLFVGNFKHEPNSDAMLWFCREILPLIWKEAPAARLRIVGDAPPKIVRDLASERIEVVGYVPDLRPYLCTSRVSVAPLRYGGGMKGKIGEAMAAGLPVVTTSTGIEGFGLTPGKNVLVGDHPRDFCAAVVKLLRDESTYDAVRKAGWKYISDRFSVEAVKANLLTVLDHAAARPAKEASIIERMRSIVPTQLRHLAWKPR
jgi:O-antigen biosynthesis protein